MISTRQLYTSDLEFFRRNDRGLMPLGQNSLIQDPYDTGGHLSSRTTPTSESDNRSASSSRKRVPVACERCRKRKIKCSGNEGDSQSCANCKNSGVEDDCRFFRVQSVDPQYAYRSWHGPPRYSPYQLPTHHRFSYLSVPSRCSPQAYLQYSTVPSSVDYGGYGSQNAAVDWVRSPYAGPYSSYTGDEETSPYSSHPPDYILPNTDPMSASSGYYMQGHGVRPPPSSLWPESQPCVPHQLTSQVSNAAYTIAGEPPQLFQTIGPASNLPSDRTLPNPLVSRNYSAQAVGSVEPNTGQHRSASYWFNDNSTSSAVQQIISQTDPGESQEQHIERENHSYRLQDLPTYGQMSMIEGGLPTTSLPSEVPLVVNEPQSSTPAVATEATQVAQVQAQPSPALGMSPTSCESHKTKADSPTLSYGYKGTTSRRSSLQLKTTLGQLSNGPSYCPRQMMASRREPASDACSPGCSSCNTHSTRTSVTSISNVSSGY